MHTIAGLARVSRVQVAAWTHFKQLSRCTSDTNRTSVFRVSSFSYDYEITSGTIVAGDLWQKILILKKNFFLLINIILQARRRTCSSAASAARRTARTPSCRRGILDILV